MRFRIKHLLWAMTAAAVALLVFERAKTPKTATVVVAAADLPRGLKITPCCLTLKQWPRDLVPEGAFTSIADAVDRTVDVPILRGDPIFVGKVTDKGDGVAALIRPGMRAFTLAPTSVSTKGVARLSPDDRVDVLLTTPESTTTLLHNVGILIVSPTGPNEVTLHVTLEEAAKLSQAITMGKKLAVRVRIQ